MLECKHAYFHLSASLSISTRREDFEVICGSILQLAACWKKVRRKKEEGKEEEEEEEEEEAFETS